MISHEKNLSASELRRFGLILGALFPLFFNILVPLVFTGQISLQIWPLIIFITLASWALMFPKGLSSVHWVWMLIGDILARINNTVILAFLFFFIFSAFGIFLRLMRRDHLRRNFDKECDSYRKVSQTVERRHMENPY